MKRPTAYLKVRVLGALDSAPGKSIRDRIRAVSRMSFEGEDGSLHRFTWRTIETWRTRYRKHGFTGMTSRPRSDKGRPRKIEVEHLLEAIEQVLPSFHGTPRTMTQVYRACIERGLIRGENVARTTFLRLVKEYDLLKPDREVENKKRLAFAKAHPNEMWQADTMFGPPVRVGTASVPTKFIAFIDDCSRVLCHGEFFLAENVENFMKALRSALYKRGIPQQLYVDNGSTYTSKEIVLVCARLGCLLYHAPIHDGAAKGKIERFFRTVRDGFLSRTLDLSSLDHLNRAFSAWVEDEYNSRIHSVLGMRPIDRFGLDLSRIRFLPPNEINDELFFAEKDRYVKEDNTFPLNTVRFEAPRDLRGKKIQVRYNRQNFDRRAIVFYKGDRMGVARPVDFVANDRHPAPPGDPA